MGIWIRVIIMCFALHLTTVGKSINREGLRSVAQETNASRLNYARIYLREEPDYCKRLLLDVDTLNTESMIEVSDLLLEYVAIIGNDDTLGKYVPFVIALNKSREQEVINYLNYRIFCLTNFTDYEAVYSETLKISEELLSSESKYIRTKILFDLGYSAAYISKLDSAQHYENLYAGQRRPNDVYFLAKLKLAILSIAEKSFDDELMYQYIDQLIKLTNEHSLYWFKSKVWFQLARFKYEQNKLADALRLNDSAIYMLRKKYDLSFRSDISSCYFNVGSCYMGLDSINKGLSFYDSALLYDVNGERLGLIHLSQSNMFTRKKEWNKARMSLNQSILLFSQKKDTLYLGITLANLAFVEQETKNTNKAIEYALRAEKLLKNSKDKIRVLQGVLDIQINGHVLLGQYKLAYNKLRQKEKVNERLTEVNLSNAQLKFDSDQQRIMTISDKKIAELKLQKLESSFWFVFLLYSSVTLFLILVGFYVFMKVRKKNIRNSNKLGQLRNEMEFQNRRHSELAHALELRLRKDLANELHDNTLGTIAGIRLLSQNVNTKITKLQNIGQIERDELSLLFYKCSSALSRAYNDMRTYIDDLRLQDSPVKPKSSVLIDIEDFIRLSLEAKNIDVTVDYDLEEDNQVLPDIIQVELVRVVREVTHNIIKHAEASSCLVKIKWTKQMFVISIFDNGLGQNKIVTNNGRGLQSIKERIKQLGGSFEIISKKGEGTIVDVTINL